MASYRFKISRTKGLYLIGMVNSRFYEGMEKISCNVILISKTASRS